MVATGFFQNDGVDALPVATIAFALGFNDPAYFSRLFAGATGLSPRRFRDKVHAGG